MRRPLVVPVALAVLVALLAGCGGKPDPERKTGVDVRSFALRSEAVGRTLKPHVLAPRARRDGAPLLVLLHFQGGTPEAMITDELVDALERAGKRAPVVLLPEADGDSYWHDRRDGAWARMVLEEAIPAAAKRFGADPERVSVAGTSMGGFGALHLAGLRRFCSVSAHSPAVFRRRPRRGTPFEDAFDSAADFARADPIPRARKLPMGTWVDVGHADPFAPAVRSLVRRMRAPRYRAWRGGHDFAFWRAQTPTWLRFHLDRLERC